MSHLKQAHCISSSSTRILKYLTDKVKEDISEKTDKKKQDIILPLELPEKILHSKELLEALTWSKANLGKCMQISSRQEHHIEGT